MGRTKQTKKMAKQRFAQMKKMISLKDPRVVEKIDPQKVARQQKKKKAAQEARQVC